MNSAKKGSTAQSIHNNKQTGVSASGNSSGGASGGTVMFKRAAVPTTESDIANLDLNVVSDVRVTALLFSHKEIISVFLSCDQSFLCLYTAAVILHDVILCNSSLNIIHPGGEPNSQADHGQPVRS